MAPAAVTVSIPYWRTPATIARAVESLLGQTHHDLTVVVVNDGDTHTPPWPALTHITDPRLIRFDLPENHGRYFADAVVLAACDTPWFALCDADDWAEPTWLDAMLTKASRDSLDAVFATQLIHPGENRPGRLHPVRDLHHLGPRLVDIAHHAALYRTTALRAVGGPHPGYRIGYDTLLCNLLALTGRVGAIPTPLYHRVTRPGSLTTSPDTGFGSPLRVRNSARLQTLYTACRAAGSAQPAIDTMPAELRAAVDHEAARLRKELP